MDTCGCKICATPVIEPARVCRAPLALALAYVLIYSMACTASRSEVPPASTGYPTPTISRIAVETQPPAPANRAPQRASPVALARTATSASPTTMSPTASPAASPAETDPGYRVPLGLVTSDSVSRRLTVQGTVSTASSFSKGFKFVLADDTGQIVLLLWHNVYDDCWDAERVNVGAVVRATGTVVDFDGELEIQPRRGSEVQVVSSHPAWAEPRQIGTLAGGDVGRRVMIDGHVLRCEGLRDSVKVFVADESGEVVVFLWRNILARVAHSTLLGTPGSRVRAIGAVQVYRSNLELVPALPADVVVGEDA
jgi:DNA/RNA endonuclease YhcR with UshA esterase domain